MNPSPRLAPSPRLSQSQLRLLTGVLALLQLFAYGLPWYDQYGGQEASGWELMTVGREFGGEVVSPVLYVGVAILLAIATLLSGVAAVLGRSSLGLVVALGNLAALVGWVVLTLAYWDTRSIADLFNPVRILPASATSAVLFTVSAAVAAVWWRRGRGQAPDQPGGRGLR